jgi:FAD binding domain-containing protein
MLLFLFHIAIIIYIAPSLADPILEANGACDDILRTPGIHGGWSGELPYRKEQANYFSAACKDAKPACIVLPSSPQQVSTIFQILRDYPNAPFAVKSGGHNPNVGHGSIRDGVLIALAYINGTTYDKSTGLANVKPGGKWQDVVATLEPHGVTVLGARLGSVGIGGYLAGGGLSFLSSQHGIAADVSPLIFSGPPISNRLNRRSQNSKLFYRMGRLQTSVRRTIQLSLLP